MQNEAKLCILSRTRVVQLRELTPTTIEIQLGLVRSSADVSELAAISGTLSRGLRRFLTPEVFEELPRLASTDGALVPPKEWNDPVLARSKSCTVVLVERGTRPVFQIQMAGLTLQGHLAEFGALTGSFRHAIRRIFAAPRHLTMPSRAMPPPRGQALKLVCEEASGQT
ncbi:MAG: hypothetical protein GY822_03660 [Deltaproteobacteria bacterium]|nr:hypothetical protein [Deltaproteobacteria bacterium]